MGLSVCAGAMEHGAVKVASEGARPWDWFDAAFNPLALITKKKTEKVREIRLKTPKKYEKRT